MLTKKTITEAMYHAIKFGATKMPPDIRAALQKVLEEETDPMAKKHLEISLQNADMSEKGNGLVCADTGFPMFFVHAGSKTELGLEFMKRIKPEKALLIGDTIHDYETAQQMGIECVLYSGGHMGRRKLEGCGTRIIDSF